MRAIEPDGASDLELALKEASDLGVPLKGVGLLYQKGYFRQHLNIDGWQQEIYVENDAYNMPLALMRAQDGQPIVVEVDYPGRRVQAQIWCVRVGRVKLYLLDTNIPANSPGDRMITSSLYGGDRELRIRQEVMLGIGGLKALTALGVEPTVCHMNEGHAAFMALERIRCLRQAQGMTFQEALEATRAGNVFTVHTLVKAGLDEFSADLMEKYFGNYYPQLGISRDEFLSLGRMLPDDADECFKMPVLALKLSAYANGVSQLHGQVSRELWGNLWPGVPSDEVSLWAACSPAAAFATTGNPGSSIRTPRCDNRGRCPWSGGVYEGALRARLWVLKLTAPKEGSWTTLLLSTRMLR